MAETTEKDSKGKGRLGLGGGGKLSLKTTVEKRQTRQNFSHGRSKTVQVEVRKKRSTQPKLDTAEASPSAASEIMDPAQLANLTEGEVAARAKALEEANKAEEERKIHKAEEAERMAEKAGRGPGPVSEPAVEARAEPGPENEAQKIAEAQALAQSQETRPVRTREDSQEAERAKPRKAAKAEPRKQAPTARYEDRRRRSGKLSISDALNLDEGRQRSAASFRRAREREKQKQREQLQEGKKVVREVIVPEAITVQELAQRMAERGGDVVKSLMKLGVMATITQTIDADTAELVVEEFGHKIKRVSEADVEDALVTAGDAEGDLEARAPVVTVMGHVDHGKTSLLDAMRSTDVAAHEAGGITQHIGAYQVETPSGAKISFIDTPGHAAFTEMRARGAKVTDIVVLCVAADDGVMPQTIEAIAHSKAAEVPMIVAINKMDKPEADSTRVKTELLQHDVQVEDMGGDVQAVEVSALKKMNLDKLEEAILLQSELLELKANPDRTAEGVIVESKIERGKGSVATVLVQKGTLNVGDIFVCGAEWGRVRAMMDAGGRQVRAAGPSMPVEVLGLQGTPGAGDDFVVVDTEAKAREVAEFRQRRDRERQAAASARGSLEQMFERIQEGEAEGMPVVVKADVHGSLEAILGALDKLAGDEVKVRILHSGVGGVNESDVTLARASGALVIGFNVRANPQARDLAKRDGVDIRYYSIIYDLTDDVRKVLSGMLAPEIRETFLGYAEIKEVFSISKVGKIAGCVVTEGQVKRGARVRLLRDDTVIHEGELSQLKRFKDDAREVGSGMECGMAFSNYQDLQAGDRIECFNVEEVAREL